MAFDDHSYAVIARQLIVPTVNSKMEYFDVMFAFKVCQGIMDCPRLRDLFRPRSLPYRLRNPRFFQESRARTNRSANFISNRLPRLLNDVGRAVGLDRDLVSFREGAREATVDFYD